MIRSLLLLWGLMAALPALAETWTLPSGQEIEGTKVEETAKVIVIEDSGGNRHVLARKTPANAEEKAAVSLEVTPGVQALLKSHDEKRMRLQEFHNQGRLSRERYLQERAKLEATFQQRIRTMLPSLSDEEIGSLIND